jgi:hypothetical protein
MTLHTLYVAIIGVSLVNSAQAKCVSHPEIRATATVEACVAVTFGASNSKYKFGDGESWPIYTAGSSLSGTLLTVSVKGSRSIWTESSGRWTNGTRLWVKGEERSLFVRTPIADGCPQVLPIEVTVETQRVCCDFGGWECLLPRTVALVNVVGRKQGR